MHIEDIQKVLVIRPVKVSDSNDINQMRRLPGVMETTLGLPSERIENNVKFIESLNDDSHVFVAVLQGYINAHKTLVESKTVGMVTLRVSNGRKRHSGSIGLMVHKEFQGNGIGTALLEKAIDLADNWLLLHRLELCVFQDNEKAIKLYGKFGFKVEGIKIDSVCKDGSYVNELCMARIKEK